MDEAFPSNEAHPVLQRAVEQRFSQRNFLRDKVLVELASSFFTAYPRLSQEYDWSYKSWAATSEQLARADDFWTRIESIVEAADYSVSRLPDDGDTLVRWTPPAPAIVELKSGDDPSANMDALSGCVSLYSSITWALSPTFELWVTQQMIFAETYAFARETGLPLTLRSARYRWTIAKNIAVALIGVAAALEIGSRYGWGVGVLAFMVWAAARTYLIQVGLQSLMHSTKLLADMKTSYVLTTRRQPCPAEIESAMTRAEQSGAVWPEGTRRILERALARNRSAWGEWNG